MTIYVTIKIGSKNTNLILLFFLFSAQTNVRTLGLPLRAPATVPTTSPTYAPAFPPSFLPSSATSPFLYPSYNWSNSAPYWCSPYFTNSAAAGAPPAANGGPHHPEGPPAIAGPPLYPIAVGVGASHHRLSEVPSSGDSRGSAEYCPRDDGSDKEGGSGQGVSRGQSPIRSQKVHHRFHPYDRASSSSSSKKRDFEETVSICEGKLVFLFFIVLLVLK